MGCNKICQAKKEAEKGKKMAADAKRQADAARNMPPTPGVPKPTGVDVNIVTVGHILNVHESKNALTPWEVMGVLGQARGNSKIMGNPTAAGLVNPLTAAFGTYIALTIAQLVPLIVKPAVRIAVQINGIIVFNFAMLGELLADIALFILTIFVGLAPMMLSILKNIFLSIPIDIGIMQTYQLDQLKELIELSKIDIKNAFLRSTKKVNAHRAKEEHNKKYSPKIDFSNTSSIINDYIANNNPPYDLDAILDKDALREQFIKAFEDGMKSCKEIILDDLANELLKININILDIEDVDTFDEENKGKVKQVSEGLHDATKRIEMLQAGEILKRQFSVSGMPPSQEGQVFDDNDLALAAANNMLAALEKLLSDLSNLAELTGEKRNVDVDEVFMLSFHDEVEKKKEKTLEIREDIAAIDLAKDLILQNKGPFISSMMNKVNAIKVDKEAIINIDTCYEQSVTNDFNILKSIILTQQTAFINTSIVENTSHMISLRDSVFANARQSVIDALIIVDHECQNNFGKSVCKSIDDFKRALYAEIKVSIEAGTIPIDELPVPTGIDKFELKKMLNILLDEVKKKLIKQGMDIIIEEAIPCKSCKPCEDMIGDMNIYVNKTINKSKDNIIKYLQGYIMNSGRDWTITDELSIENQKAYLIGQLTMALQQPSGELQLVDDMLFRLKMEEEELLKNVRQSLQAV
jgi:hypothetical protein